MNSADTLELLYAIATGLLPVLIFMLVIGLFAYIDLRSQKAKRARAAENELHAARTLLLDACQRTKEPYTSVWGICEHLTYYGIFPAHGPLVRELFTRWPKFSGNIGYPVPDPRNELRAADAFAFLPKWTGEYGALRMELLDFMIAELTKELEKSK